MHVLLHLDLTTMIPLTGMLVHSLSVAIKRSIMVTEEVAEPRKVCTEKACLKNNKRNKKFIGSPDIGKAKTGETESIVRKFYFMKIT